MTTSPVMAPTSITSGDAGGRTFTWVAKFRHDPDHIVIHHTLLIFGDALKHGKEKERELIFGRMLA